MTATDPLRDAFYAACPGIELTRDMETALYALSPTATAAQIQAVILPLVPEGNPFQYTAGAPPAIGILMPGASPVLPPALPPQPVVLLPIDGNPATPPINPVLGTVATFAKGLKRFQDSNPDWLDGWSIDQTDSAGPW